MIRIWEEDKGEEEKEVEKEEGEEEDDEEEKREKKEVEMNEEGKGKKKNFVLHLPLSSLIPRQTWQKIPFVWKETLSGTLSVPYRIQ